MQWFQKLIGSTKQKSEVPSEAGEWRIQAVLKGHQHYVTSIAFFPSGKTLVTGSNDDTAMLWDATGKCIRTFRGHDAGVYGVAFSPDERHVATASFDRTARLWDVATGHEIRRFAGHTDNVQGVAFSPGGKRLVTCGWDATVRIWDVESGKEMSVLSAGRAELRCVAISSEQSQIAAAGSGEVLVWSSKNGQMLFKVHAHTKVAFSPDGSMIGTCGWSGSVKLWDASSGAELQSFPFAEPESVAFSPDGLWFAAGSGDCVAGQRPAALEIWNLQRKISASRIDAHEGRIASLAFSPSGASLASASYDGTAKIWTLKR